MYKIFIVEDDPGIVESVSMLFAGWGMETKCAADFKNIIPEFLQYSPHLVLLDISLPFMDGYHWCSEIRKVSQIPIVFISSASENMNIIMAINMGADDFIAKPFDGQVLLAKIQALLRRTYDFSEGIPVLEHRGAILNISDRTFVYEDQQIALSKNEYRILSVLMQAKGRVVSREKLMESLWQTDEFVDENALTVNVGRLRKKLNAAGLEHFIETKFGEGYRIN